jgi:hypothetical protein
MAAIGAAPFGHNRAHGTLLQHPFAGAAHGHDHHSGLRP